MPRQDGGGALASLFTTRDLARKERISQQDEQLVPLRLETEKATLELQSLQANEESRRITEGETKKERETAQKIKDAELEKLLLDTKTGEFELAESSLNLVLDNVELALEDPDGFLDLAIETGSFDDEDGGPEALEALRTMSRPDFREFISNIKNSRQAQEKSKRDFELRKEREKIKGLIRVANIKAAKQGDPKAQKALSTDGKKARDVSSLRQDAFNPLNFESLEEVIEEYNDLTQLLADNFRNVEDAERFEAKQDRVRQAFSALISVRNATLDGLEEARASGELGNDLASDPTYQTPAWEAELDREGIVPGSPQDFAKREATLIAQIMQGDYEAVLKQYKIDPIQAFPEPVEEEEKPGFFSGFFGG